MINNASPDLGTACPPQRDTAAFGPRIMQKKRPMEGAMMSARCSQKLGADEQRA
jgi:hypothetical protein